MGKQKPLERIKSGMLARTMALTKMTVAAGARAAGHAVGTMFADDESKQASARKLLLAQLSALVGELGQLKGSAMKAGQMLSMYGEHFLPPEANAIVKSLQAQSTPMSFAAILAALQKALPAAKLAELDIEATPHAAASLGQVHVARHRASGQKLALKVQYPGVEAAIASDLRVIRRILNLSRLLPQAFDEQGVFAEVRQMLEQEADYVHEAKETLFFGDALRGDARFVVAKPQLDYCSRHVLCTSFEEGIGLDDPAVLSLPQQRRNALGEAALELYMKELWHLHKVQTDPHFGNYRVRLGSPDQLVVLDFGATRTVPSLYVAGYRDLVTGACRQDSAQVVRGGMTLKFLEPGDADEVKALFYELCQLIVEPFIAPQPHSAHLFSADGCYDWGRSDLPKRLARRGAQVALSFKLRAPPRESLFLDRKLGGMFIILSTLKVKIAGRDIVARYLPIDAPAAEETSPPT